MTRHFGSRNSSAATTTFPLFSTTPVPNFSTTTTNAPATTTTNAPTAGIAPATTTTIQPAPPATTTTNAPATTTTVVSSDTALPTGTVDSSEPSGMAPPGANDLAGYSQSYVSDFTGSSLPSGWSAYSGNPGGDPGAQWAPSHVVVGGGLLSLNTFQDSSFNNEWVTGGLCQCGVSTKYGAYFVRSRLSG
ncbi:MAG: hypothetical protein ABI298_05215, partial [Acidimicrobiales bacterium]